MRTNWEGIRKASGLVRSNRWRWPSAAPRKQHVFEALELRMLLNGDPLADSAGAGSQAAMVVIPSGQTVEPGGSISLPVTIDNAAGLQAIDITIHYDTALFDVGSGDVVIGNLLLSAGGWVLLPNVDDAAGVIDVTAFTIFPMAGGSGTIMNVTFSAANGAIKGISRLDLDTRLNEDLIPSVSVDGDISIGGDVVPTVVEVLVRGSSWPASFLQDIEAAGAGAGGVRIESGPAQLAPVQWSGIDEVIVRFNTVVDVQQEDLQILGLLGPDGVDDDADGYVVEEFFTDISPTSRFEVVWRLAAPLKTDKLLLALDSSVPFGVATDTGKRLDGEWVDTLSGYPSGDGEQGGDFLFRFNALTVDSNNDGQVDIGDIDLLRASLGSIAGDDAYSPFADLDSDGIVSVFDLGIAHNNFGTTLPDGEPATAAATASSVSAISLAAAAAAPSTGGDLLSLYRARLSSALEQLLSHPDDAEDDASPFDLPDSII